ncbi:hypothetical protein QT318_08775 [Escherichia coli]|nr:hypothetical protein [Escherichia coli]
MNVTTEDEDKRGTGAMLIPGGVRFRTAGKERRWTLPDHHGVRGEWIVV